jgi:hypothetical protein
MATGVLDDGMRMNAPVSIEISSNLNDFAPELSRPRSKTSPRFSTISCANAWPVKIYPVIANASVA